MSDQKQTKFSQVLTYCPVKHKNMASQTQNVFGDTVIGSSKVNEAKSVSY